MTERSRILAGVTLVSADILALEIILTRFFSIAQGYHYAFLVVSLAFLGFGLGSLFLFSRKLKDCLTETSTLAALAFGLGLMIPLSIWLVNLLPFNPVELLWNQKKIFMLGIHYLIFSGSFLLGGLIISAALTKLAGITHQVYFADLSGAAAGIILAGAGFRLAGDRGAILLPVMLALTASVVFALAGKGSRFLKLIHLLSAVFVTALIFFAGSHLEFKISEYKPLPFYLRQKDAGLMRTVWDEKLRLDIFRSPAVRYAPGLSLSYEGRLPDQLGLALDAERIYALSADEISSEQSDFVTYLPVWPAFEFSAGGRILLLKPAGDLELLLALKASPTKVRVFEESDLLRKIHLSRLKNLAQKGWDLPPVELITVEPRAGLIQEKKNRIEYDLILFPLPDLPGSFSTGFYGPGEDYLLTLESLDTIFTLLSPDGLVAAVFYFLPPPRQEIRYLALWIEYLENRGLRPEEHIIIIKSVETATFLIKKNPFTDAEIEQLRRFAGERLYDLNIPDSRKEESQTFIIQPNISLWEELISFLFHPEKRHLLYDNYLFDISPVNDNRPFFRDFMKWERWPEVKKFFQQTAYPLFTGKYLLVFLLGQALVTGLLIIILPLTILARRELPEIPRKTIIFFYFASLGAGYMLVEITLFNRFLLLIGHPTYSLSAVLFFLLGSSGAGSLSLNILQKKTGRYGPLLWPLICLAAIIFEAAVLKLAGSLFLSLSLPGRLALGFALVFPLGFFLGMPFPAGLNYFQSKSRMLAPFAFAANSFFSLLASVWALVQAQLFGHQSVLVSAAIFYLFSFLFLYFTYHRDKANIE